MRKKTLLMTAFAVAGAAWLALGTTAHANITPNFVAVVADGSNWDYTYDIQIDDTQELVPDNAGSEAAHTNGIVTLYDFAGFTQVLATPTNFTYTNQLTGVDTLVPPSAIGFPDNPAIQNVTIYYEGTSTITGFKDLGDLVIQSSIGPNLTIIAFAGQAKRIQTGLTGQNTSTTFGPSAAVPLPAASWMGLALLGALGALQIRRSRSQA